MKSIILTHSLFEDKEVIYPYYRLQEETTNPEEDVILAAEKIGEIYGISGTKIKATMHISELHHLKIMEWNLLVLPGGVRAMEKLRQDDIALEFIKCWFSARKPIAVICSGAQMLISARVPLQGRRLTAYPAMAVDVENTGAIYINSPLVVDGNLISSPHYNYLTIWVVAAIIAAQKK